VIQNISTRPWWSAGNENPNENTFRPFGRSRAFQNGSARTRSDTDAAHMRKAPGVMQMRQMRQMQIDEDACIRNWTDEPTSRESHSLYTKWTSTNDTSQRVFGSLSLRKVVRLINHNLNQRVGWWEKKDKKTDEGLTGNYSSDTRSSWIIIANPTRCSNKTSTAWSCAEDQILENKNSGTRL